MTTTKTSKLEEQIQKISAALDAARQASAAAGEKLATNPTDLELLAAAREAKQKVSDLEADLGLMKDALEAAGAADLRAAIAATRNSALANLKCARALCAQRVKAAASVDAALARLRETLDSWQAINAECGDAVENFYRNAMGDDFGAVHGYAAEGRTLVHVIGNALADHIHEAVRVLDVGGYLAFNHVRRQAGVIESAQNDAEKSSNRVMSRMQEVAKARGLA